MSNSPQIQPSKQKWRLEKDLSMQTLSPYLEASSGVPSFSIINAAVDKKNKTAHFIYMYLSCSLPGGQNLSLAVSCFHSLFPFPFLFHFSPPSPPPFPSMFQEISAWFKGSLLAWPAPWWSGGSLQANGVMEHQRTTGISAPLHKHLSRAGQ